MWLSLHKKQFRPVLMVVLIAMLTTISGVAAAAPDFMPVDDVKTGMHGMAKTVVAGDTIEEFGVEVLGILKNKGPVGDLILVRTYGSVIDRTGGIVQGMSGSPVYINDKLVGAVAYGWGLTDHTIGMVTPIGDMLRIWELEDRLSRSRRINDGPNLDDIDTSSGDEEPAKNEELKPLATPVMVSGLGDSALAMLKEKLKPYNLVPYTTGTMPEGSGQAALMPGSAVGVELVRGDVSLSAIGTVTYVDGDKVLAFGHPFLKRGNTGYFMSSAYIFTTVKGLENGFKVGAVGDLIGTFNQDRGSGIAGQKAKYPSIVPLRLTVRDSTNLRTQDMAVQIVNDEQLAPILAATTVFNGIDKVTDRSGPGTARVSFEISAKGSPVDTIKRENMFYSPGNIGELAVFELHEALAMLAGNQFKTVDIMDVKVNVTIDEERKTASIVEARSRAASAKPGEVIDIEVKLKPFRSDMITRTVSYTVPKSQQPGPLTLEVRGGGMVPLMQLLLERQGLDKDILKGGKQKQRSFEEIVNDFTSRDRNNDIVVEVLSMEAGDTPSGEQPKSKKPVVETEPKPSPRPASKVKAADKLDALQSDRKNEAHKNYVSTDYIVEGDTQILLNIVALEKK